MKQRSVTHATFTIERTYPASPARVFKAFADKEAKARWFGGSSDWTQTRWDMDFRAGGREINSGKPKQGPSYTMEAHYWDIIPNERIVYTYDMHMDDTRISVSLTTVELRPEGTGTRLVLIEQGAFLDGHDTPAQREAGTRELMDALGASLQQTA
ncbi:SRPBCC family protein [Pyxidicoccus sp. 3LG]